jgi:hypothetical protein
MWRFAIMAAAAAVLAGCGTTAQRGGFDASSARIDNTWFPLKPGTTYVYAGVRDGKPSRDVVTVTGRTEMVHGVRCAVIDDRLYLAGRLGERTTDWYAQDRAGNVWYLGEATAELDRRGRVTGTAGTWRAGRNGAVAGIYMPAHPRVGQSMRQEYYRGQAEDHFRVLSLSNGHTLVTEEWTPLEPGVLDHKVYRRGVGTVREEAVRGGNERAVLVSVRHEAPLP